MPGCTSAKSSCHGEMHCGLCADRAAEDDDESYDLADCLTCEDGYTFKQLNWDCTGTCVDTSDWCAQPVCNDSDDDGSEYHSEGYDYDDDEGHEDVFNGCSFGGCQPQWQGDGQCHCACLIPECGWDSEAYDSDDYHSEGYDYYDVDEPTQDCEVPCAKMCHSSFRSDGQCDEACNNAACGWDGDGSSPIDCECPSGKYEKDGVCTDCTDCGDIANAEEKTACTADADTVCQCSIGWAGDGATCHQCDAGATYAAQPGWTSCKACRCVYLLRMLRTPLPLLYLFFSLCFSLLCVYLCVEAYKRER